ncbi:MAG: transcriptional regulator NrdR [Dysosmobacter sp.]
MTYPVYIGDRAAGTMTVTAAGQDTVFELRCPDPEPGLCGPGSRRRPPGPGDSGGRAAAPPVSRRLTASLGGVRWAGAGTAGAGSLSGARRTRGLSAAPAAGGYVPPGGAAAAAGPALWRGPALSPDGAVLLWPGSGPWTAGAGRNTAFWAGTRCPRKKSEIWVYHNPAICGIIPWSITTKEERPMRCPYCGYRESKVVDSRPADEGASIRRQAGVPVLREALSPPMRRLRYLPMVVIKKDGSRQSFDRSKVLRGIQRSCEKRPVPVADMERMASEIEQEVQNSLEREVSTEIIGEKVMEKLKKADEVAYVRFASVYRQFKDINTFMSELNKLLSEK